MFTDENHAGARSLYADTLEQLGFGVECAPWRNFFLSGATELRTGNFGTPVSTASTSMLSQLTPDQMLDILKLSVNGPWPGIWTWPWTSSSPTWTPTTG